MDNNCINFMDSKSKNLRGQSTDNIGIFMVSFKTSSFCRKCNYKSFFLLKQVKKKKKCFLSCSSSWRKQFFLASREMFEIIWNHSNGVKKLHTFYYSKYELPVVLGELNGEVSGCRISDSVIKETTCFTFQEKKLHWPNIDK